MNLNATIERCDAIWPVLASCHKQSPDKAHCWAITWAWQCAQNNYQGTIKKNIQHAEFSDGEAA